LPSDLQALLLRLTPSAFDDRAAWSIVLAQTYHLQGDNVALAHLCRHRAPAFEERLRGAPDDAQSTSFGGSHLPTWAARRRLSRTREGGRADAHLGDAYTGPYIQHQLVRIYLLVGEPEKALDRLEPLLKVPYYLSPGWLRIDPEFDPIRKHPRFQRLLNESPTTKSHG
jgi:hypothetical protein